ncbi:MAG: hypothetical protein AAF335_03030 [Bacteroidota bacterium]
MISLKRFGTLLIFTLSLNVSSCVRGSTGYETTATERSQQRKAFYKEEEELKTQEEDLKTQEEDLKEQQEKEEQEAKLGKDEFGLFDLGIENLSKEVLENKERLFVIKNYTEKRTKLLYKEGFPKQAWNYLKSYLNIINQLCYMDDVLRVLTKDMSMLKNLTHHTIKKLFVRDPNFVRFVLMDKISKTPSDSFTYIENKNAIIEYIKNEPFGLSIINPETNDIKDYQEQMEEYFKKLRKNGHIYSKGVNFENSKAFTYKYYKGKEKAALSRLQNSLYINEVSELCR